MDVRRLEPRWAAPTRDLLALLQVPAFGIHSATLHEALVADALAHRIDCRLAVDGEAVAGVVLAAPPKYWRQAPLWHPRLAFECLVARVVSRRRAPPGASAPRAAQPGSARDAVPIGEDAPPVTWAEPGDAWRIIYVGTAPAARGRGIGADLYRAIAAERPLVARIAADNTASIRLHRSTGWQLFRDGEVLLAIHRGPG